VQPSKEGDFNDVLKTDGSKAISDSFAPAISRHTAETLEKYLGEEAFEATLDNVDKANLAYIQKYELSEEKIVDAYRKGDLAGKTTIGQTRKGLEMASSQYLDNKGMIEEAKQWGFKENEVDLTRSLVGMDKREASNHINNIRNEHLSSYFVENLSQFKVKKITWDFEELKTIISKEQGFLQKTFELSSVDKDLTDLRGNNRDAMAAGQLISQNPEKLDEFFNKCKTIQDNDMSSQQELCASMTYTRDIDSLLEEVSTVIERHNIRTAPEELAKIREKAESVDTAFVAIEKEQNHLANQHGTVKHLDFETELLAKCELAHNQREDNNLGDLKDISNQALMSGAKTKDELISDLQQVTDLKEAHIKLDKDVEVHHISSTLDGLEQEKQEAKTPDKIFSAIGKEQEFLSGLHGNIKYPEQHADIVDRCELAHKQKEDNSLGDLREIANQALQSGAKIDNWLMVDLYRSTDLHDICTKIEGDTENHQIKEAINLFETARDKAKTPIEAMKALEDKQSYLVDIDKVKYPYYIDKDILSSIETAKENEKDNKIEDLSKLVSFVNQDAICNNTEITRYLQEPDHLTKITENIMENYQEGHLKDVELRMGCIEKHGKTFASGKTFKGAAEYLEHDIKSSNEYAPMQQLNAMHEKVVAKELEVQQAEIRAQEKEQEQAQKASNSMDFER
jgi:hypothetical protein